MKRIRKIAIFSILISIAVTLGSGAVENISEFWMGARLWGYLLPWLVQVIAWPPQPKTILWANLIIDLAVWFLISFALLMVFVKGKTK